MVSKIKRKRQKEREKDAEREESRRGSKRKEEETFWGVLFLFRPFLVSNINAILRKKLAD